MLTTARRKFNEFARSQSLGGLVLVVAAVLALLISNSALGGWYTALLQWPGEVRVAGILGTLVLLKNTQRTA